MNAALITLIVVLAAATYGVFGAGLVLTMLRLTRRP